MLYSKPFRFRSEVTAGPLKASLSIEKDFHGNWSYIWYPIISLKTYTHWKKPDINREAAVAHIYKAYIDYLASGLSGCIVNLEIEENLINFWVIFYDNHVCSNNFVISYDLTPPDYSQTIFHETYSTYCQAKYEDFNSRFKYDENNRLCKIL